MNLRPIASNMTELKIGTKVILFSYSTPVAMVDYSGMNDQGLEYFQTDCRWSRTTTRHISKWLNGNAAKYKPQSFFDGLVA